MKRFDPIGTRAAAVLLTIIAPHGAALAQQGHGPAYLDDTYAPRALSWVAKERAATLASLSADPRFSKFESEAAAVLTDPTQPDDIRFIGDHVYAYHQSRAAPMGVWRRSTAAAWLAATPQWETVIDLDALGAAEGVRWIFGGASCRANGRCLIQLSDNGKDAAATREFDLTTGQFVRDGFNLPVGKHRTWWIDDDTLLVAPVLDRASVNISLVPRTLRVWRRGEPVEKARTLFSIGERDAMLSAMLVKAGGTDRFVAARHIDFERREYKLIDLSTGEQQPLPLPEWAQMRGMYQGKLLLRPEVDWRPAPNGPTFPAGSLVGIDLAALMQRATIEGATLIYKPHGDDAVRGTFTIGERLFVELLHDSYSRIEEVTASGDPIRPALVPIPDEQFVSVLGTPGGKLLLRRETPLEPERIELVDPDTGAAQLLYARQPAFDATNMVSNRYTTVSKDGTRISYLVMHRRGIAMDGRHPALIYGYGGYDVPVTPRYEPVFGKLWLEKGGVYVHAYLRGGGEHGPDWHRATMREHHPRAFEDMEAVIADVQRRGFSAPERTGIIGRSNGGLLVAAVMQRRPELMKAAIVGGPLIDMLNFHQLPPGGTWLAEYGNPDLAADRAFLSQYSPMQTIARAATTPYPRPLIITATDDDRVLPGHARRYAARLREQGHEALYFEDEQGGHYWELAGGPAPGDWRRRAKARAVEFTYLWHALGGQ
ncbi:prolyl oligopeptidase family serine peptidase [Sphingomonas sp. IW22]|uniref:prolyl oligopeptidase family serine peptidase n=1 Tax=Sphingomonas sp. IW22 TaxID=3242489 RepID=UPI003521F1E2